MTQPEIARKAKALKEKARPLTMTVKEASKVLGISYDRALEASAAGQLPTIVLGSRKVVPVAALERMLAEAKPEVEAA